MNRSIINIGLMGRKNGNIGYPFSSHVLIIHFSSRSTTTMTIWSRGVITFRIQTSSLLFMPITQCSFISSPFQDKYGTLYSQHALTYICQNELKLVREELSLASSYWLIEKEYNSDIFFNSEVRTFLGGRGSS